jgi:hypothetical protein
VIDEADGDGVLPTYEEKARKTAPLDDFIQQPATPQYSGSAERSPMGATIEMPSVTAPAYVEPMPGRAARRASTTPLRLASMFAVLALVFVVMLAISNQGVNPLNVNSSATATLATQFALLPTDSVPNNSATQQAATSIAATLNAQGVAPADIAVAPMVNCAGTPGADLVAQLGSAGLDAVLLSSGVTSAEDARKSADAPVIAWGVCSGDSLTLHVELVRTVQQGIRNPASVTTQIFPATLQQGDSHAVRLVRAVTDYARAGLDYTALAQIFENLASEAASNDERPDLRLFQQNSAALARRYLTPVPTQASR